MFLEVWGETCHAIDCEQTIEEEERGSSFICNNVICANTHDSDRCTIRLESIDTRNLDRIKEGIDACKYKHHQETRNVHASIAIGSANQG